MATTTIPLSDELFDEVHAMGIDGAAVEIARLRTKLGAMEAMAHHATNGHACGWLDCPRCRLRAALDRGAL